MAVPVLIVEDDGIIALHLKEILTGAGFVVLDPVASGEEAIAVIAAGHPGLVLMDINLMGEMDGIDTALEIRRQSRIPIIFLSAYSEEQQKERARSAGPVGYILKPFIDDELVKMVAATLLSGLFEDRRP